MSIVVDKLAYPAPYEGFSVCPTIHIPSDTMYYKFHEKNFKKKNTSQLAKKNYDL